MTCRHLKSPVEGSCKETPSSAGKFLLRKDLSRLINREVGSVVRRVDAQGDD